MLLVVLYVPFLEPVFHTVAPTLADWGLIVGFALIPFTAGELYKLVRRTLDRRHG
jgi:Ca2+-transporting ATPase